MRLSTSRSRTCPLTFNDTLDVCFMISPPDWAAAPLVTVVAATVAAEDISKFRRESSNMPVPGIASSTSSIGEIKGFASRGENADH
ncbi:protein of unknown function [Agrobacterium pusense]|uniref:Uncharacterized protein n=1 Tax=Agrobacterium pusense TaxID=648995 RepID=U4Q0F9_9HYPH|nr:protein of unknown function [Agrobacterium pusense]